MKKFFSAALIIVMVISIFGIGQTGVLAENEIDLNEFEIEYNIAYFRPLGSMFARGLPMEREEGCWPGVSKILSYEEFCEYFSNVPPVFSKYDETVFEDRFLLIVRWGFGCPGVQIRVTSVSLGEGVDVALTADFTKRSVLAVVEYGAIFLEIPASQLGKNVNLSPSYIPIGFNPLTPWLWPVSAEPNIMPGEVLVGFHQQYDGSFSSEEFPGLNVVQVKDMYLSVYEKIHGPINESSDVPSNIRDKIGLLFHIKLANETKEAVWEAIQILKQHPNVRYAEPNGIMSAAQGNAAVTGAVKSYNPKAPTTICLTNDDVSYETIIPGAAVGSGQAEKAFAFNGVAPGIYSMTVSKQGHADFTVPDIIVAGEDVDMTLDGCPEVRLMALRCGDIDGDGLINDSDLTVLWATSNYNGRTENASNPLCDLNGDGMINDVDLTILWMANNYNRGEVTVSR